MPSKANTFQSPTAPLTSRLPAQIEQEASGNLPWVLSQPQNSQTLCRPIRAESRGYRDAEPTGHGRLKRIPTVPQTVVDWVPGNMYILKSLFSLCHFEVVSLCACVLHKWVGLMKNQLQMGRMVNMVWKQNTVLRALWGMEMGNGNMQRAQCGLNQVNLILPWLCN